MKYTYSDQLYSDLHKDAYGFRPGMYGYHLWDAMNADQKQAEWDRLLVALNDSIVLEQLRETEAKLVFEEKIARLMEVNVISRKAAVQQLYDEMEFQYDYGYADYTFGLPYGTFAKELNDDRQTV